MSQTIPEADREHYMRLLEDAAEPEAVDFAQKLLARGVPAQEVLLQLVAASQAEVGRRWAENRWSVAQEHAATHLNEQVVAAVATTIRPAQPSRGRIAVACVDGEWHSLPARLFAEVLRLHGWEVRFLGASVPGPHLVSYLHSYDPLALAVSCSLPTRLAAAKRTIEAAQEAGVAVLAGGAGFGENGRWARRLGADRVATDAVQAAQELAAWLPATPRSSPHPLLVGDDEDVMVSKHKQSLVDSGMRLLGERFPALARYSGHQRQATLEDLGHIADFLSASLLVDDAEMFTSFIGWLCIILESRRVPISTVDVVLEAYQRELYDYPRALRHLSAGRRQL
ncbi:cobalamin-binding protein [Rhizocola hellebori]|uniref:Cobalamin-binding protein n=1 Tax=Rhizocola hellebori TaxID=1392758 RepID=A0A8J3Q9Y9_9ACTN|nr:cobalamin-dependent protein [Rhizocola hellebori]GIH05765.1 cobalamin-binding protein [Rhizocola hellebori]